MRKTLTGAAAAVVLALSPAQEAKASVEEPANAIVFVIENGAVVTDPDGVMETVRHAFGETVEYRRHRSMQHVEVTIILSAQPNAVAWTGSPKDLYAQGQQVMDMITFSGTCSDLVMAYEEISTLVTLTAPETLDLISIGPAIHFGYPCESATITLPQAVPEGSKLAELAGTARSVRMYEVHPDQDQALTAYFAEHGIIARAHAGEMELEVRDAARTRALYGELLGGRR